MKIRETKQQIDFYVDSLFQSGYDLGWNSVIEEIEQQADAHWNEGNTVTSDIMRKFAESMREGDWDEVE